MQVPGFEEEVYLAANPDVRAAVERGEFESGLVHYLTFGCYELRRGAPLLPDEEGLADHVPPRRLRVRVHGALDLQSFLDVGLAVASDVATLAATKINLTKDSKVLDFGCGCGRIVAQFRTLSNARLFGTDIDSEAIGWCRDKLGSIAEFRVNDPVPPLSYADDSFDLIYSISIFSHLPEDLQSQWLAELNRLLSPGGVALLTVHGASLFPYDEVTSHVAADFDRDGFAYLVGDGTEGLPDFYQTSFNSKCYIADTWNRFLDVEEVLPRAAGGHQDMIVCRKRR